MWVSTLQISSFVRHTACFLLSSVLALLLLEGMQEEEMSRARGKTKHCSPLGHEHIFWEWKNTDCFLLTVLKESVSLIVRLYGSGGCNYGTTRTGIKCESNSQQSRGYSNCGEGDLIWGGTLTKNCFHLFSIVLHRPFGTQQVTIPSHTSTHVHHHNFESDVSVFYVVMLFPALFW